MAFGKTIKDLRKAEFDAACFEYWKHDDFEQ